MEEMLRRYIQQELAPGRARRLSLDEPLFESVLDSTNVVSLVSFLEESFQMQIPDRDIVPSNFATLRQLVNYLAQRSSVQASASAG